MCMVSKTDIIIKKQALISRVPGFADVDPAPSYQSICHCDRQAQDEGEIHHI